MTDLLDNGETPARKAHLCTLIGAIIVGDKSVKIVGSKDAVRAAIFGEASPSKVFLVWDRNGAPGTIERPPPIFIAKRLAPAWPA